MTKAVRSNVGGPRSRLYPMHSMQRWRIILRRHFFGGEPKRCVATVCAGYSAGAPPRPCRPILKRPVRRRLRSPAASAVFANGAGDDSTGAAGFAGLSGAEHDGDRRAATEPDARFDFRSAAGCAERRPCRLVL